MVALASERLSQVGRQPAALPLVQLNPRCLGGQVAINAPADPEKPLALGVTAARVNDQVRADNVDLGGGRGEVAGQEQAIRTVAGARSVADLAALPIALSGGRKVRLDELGTITDGAAEPRTFARLFDAPIVAFSVSRSKGASDVTVDRLGECAHRRQIGEIELDHRRRAADLGRTLLTEFGVAHSQNHMGTGLGQTTRRAQPHAVRRSRHDDSFAGQVAEPARRPR